MVSTINQDSMTVSHSEVSGASATTVLSNSVATLGRWQTVDESSSDDEDEILWTGNELDSDDDFVLVPHVRAAVKPSSSPARCDEVTREVIQGITNLSFSQPANDSYSASVNTERRNKNTKAKVAKGGKSDSNSNSCLFAAPVSTAQQGEQAHKKAKGSGGKRGRTAKKKAKDSGSTSAIAAFNDAGNNLLSSPYVELDAEIDTKYEGAVSFITSFLQTSTTALNASQRTRLTFLQSLIIELGLMSPDSALPSSLNSATRFLKAHAFLNVRDYLSVRHEGFERLQQVMFKSRKALANDLRKNKGRRQLDRAWVKEHGLSVFLVQT